MSLRVFERHDASFGAYFEVDAILETTRTEFQEIQILDTARHGRVMLIDGLTMLTEHTHYVYHELMAHTPMACVAAPKSALVIGGGDGGVVTELVKHPNLERVVLAEIDGGVVEASRRWFPEVAAGLDDPRVEIRIGDGAAYLAAQSAAFDVIVIDSTDVCEEAGETAVASPLATDRFYADLKTALRPGGACTQILGSLTFYTASMTTLLQRLDGLWPRFEPLMMPCPFYITGDWIAGLFGVDGDLAPYRFPLDPARLRYANPDAVRGALAAPNDVLRALGRLGPFAG